MLKKTRYRSRVNYEDLEHSDFMTMDGGQLHAVFCSLLNLSVENSFEAEKLHKEFAKTKSAFILCDDVQEKRSLSARLAILKGDIDINKIRSATIKERVSASQTILRTFGK